MAVIPASFPCLRQQGKEEKRAVPRSHAPLFAAVSERQTLSSHERACCSALIVCPHRCAGSNLCPLGLKSAAALALKQPA